MLYLPTLSNSFSGHICFEVRAIVIGIKDEISLILEFTTNCDDFNRHLTTKHWLGFSFRLNSLFFQQKPTLRDTNSDNKVDVDAR